MNPKKELISPVKVVGKKVALGNSNFAEIIQKDILYSDKSLLIKEIIEDASKAILISRPRRWGKTLNISMLQHFFAAKVNEDSTNGLFTKLLINNVDDGKYMEHQGKYPVIMISLKGVQSETFVGAVFGIGGLINSLYTEHYYLKTSEKLTPENKDLFTKFLQSELTQQDIETSLGLLSRLLHKHYGQKCYILIDEYDTPVNTSYQYGYFESMILLMKNMLGNALKDNNSLEKGIMTGILRISKNSILSDLNNLETYTILNKKYKEYFGFIDQELDLLFKKCNLERNEDELKNWYNGYLIGGLTLYNPWSIMSCLKNEGDLRAYWVSTGNDSLIKNLLQNANTEIKEEFQQLMLGKNIKCKVNDAVRFDNLENAPKAVWSMLLYTGYLTLVSSKLSESIDYDCILKIPNKEIRALYSGIFLDWLGGEREISATKAILYSLVVGDVTRFANDLEEFLLDVASIRDYATNPEVFYHSIMLGLTESLRNDYYIESNKESGFGYPDLIFIPKEKIASNKMLSKAVILEFKQVKRNEVPQKLAENALLQIDVKNYIEKIKKHVYIQEIVKVGLAFHGKKVSYSSAIEVV